MSCRDDADNFDIVLFAHGVSNQQHQDALDNPYRLPSLFAAFDTVLLYESIGVGKNAGRRLKAHAVLSEVAGRFGGVPFKARLHALMLLHFRSFIFAFLGFFAALLIRQQNTVTRRRRCWGL